MSVTRTLLAAEYAAMRLPLTLLESRVVTKYLPEESRFRLGFEKSLGSLDSIVGKVVGSADLTRRGAQLHHKAELRGTAVALEERAEAREATADAELRKAKAAAERKRTEAQERTQADVADLRRRQQEEKQAAAQQAQQKTEAAGAATVREAEKQVAQVDRQAAQQKQRIERQKQTRTAAPKAEFAGATELSAQAKKQRAAAERLHELTAQEKAARTS
jgi:hypothetical protein